MAETLSYVHRFEKGTEADARSLLLLHGTGGDENDLLPLGRMVAPGAPLLSVRGKAMENGMPRFFRRFGEGIFDEDDLRRRANELADFVAEARAHYGIASPIHLVGEGQTPSDQRFLQASLLRFGRAVSGKSGIGRRNPYAPKIERAASQGAQACGIHKRHPAGF